MSFKSFRLAQVKSNLRRFLYAPLVSHLDRNAVVQAVALAAYNDSRKKLNDLSDVEFSAFSQWGEDGIIAWLTSRLLTIPKTFVEFGVENYRESNTRLLLQMRNWRGLVLDGSEANIDDIRRQNIYWRYSLTAQCAFIDRDNINDFINRAGIGGEIGLLSIDIDGNDYWVWESIDVVDPAIVVVEYNAVLGDVHSLTVPYDASFQRTVAHHSNLYFGASLPALIGLGRQKGYTFIGTTSTGCNAFFVRNNIADLVTSALSGAWAYPSKTRESRDENGNLTYIAGKDRAQVITRLPLENLLTGTKTCLDECGILYSDEWQIGERALL